MERFLTVGFVLEFIATAIFFKLGEHMLFIYALATSIFTLVALAKHET